MSPLSDDPERRARQLANLRPGAGAWQPGKATNIKSGWRTRRPERVLLGEAFGEIVGALEDQVPLRGDDGEMLPAFTTAVEAAALQLIIVRRILGFLQTHGWEDERKRMRPEVDRLQGANERLSRAMDRLGATPTSYARLGFDVARGQSLAEQMAVLAAEDEAPPAAATDDDIEGEATGRG